MPQSTATAGSASTATVKRGLRYSVTPDGQPLLADIYVPSAGRPRAAVLYFHGGGWEVGARTDHEGQRAFALAARGYLVASVTYRLTHQAPFPAQRDDARAAADWLRTQLRNYDVEAELIGAWGASAGGHLATLLALGNPEENTPPSVDAGVAWFAPCDLSLESGGTPLELELFPPASVEALLGGRFDRNDARHRAADPISLVSSAAAPLMLATGDRDRVVEAASSFRMHDALVRAGAASVLQVFGGAGHEDAAFEATTGIGSVAAFFEQHLVQRRSTHVA